MNGISMFLFKSSCPMYNLGTINKITLIPRRFSNVHLQSISLLQATTRMLKHRVYPSSASKDKTGSRSEVPEVGGTVVPNISTFGFSSKIDLGSSFIVGFVLGIGMALVAAWPVAQSILTVRGVEGILKSNARYFIFLGVAAAFVARGIVGNIVDGLSLKLSQAFSIGDVIKVCKKFFCYLISYKLFISSSVSPAGCSVEGQVIEMRLTTTVLLSEENRLIVVPNSSFCGQAIIVNKSRVGWRTIVYKFVLSTSIYSYETIIPKISEEMVNMMKSNPNVLLEKEQPYCYLSRVVGGSLYELTLGCNLKEMSKDKLFSTKGDVLLQAVQIVKNNYCHLDDL